MHNIIKISLLAIILAIGLMVRLYKIDNPIADWHSWRQADTAAVARNFYKEGYNPFMPKFDDMSPIQENPQPNPNRYRFVEFPIYNSLVYFAYLLNGGVDERLARLVSVLMSLGSTVFIYLITRKHLGEFTGFIAALLFAILPYNIFYSRVVLPEPTLVFFSLAALYFTERWIWEGGLRLYGLSISMAMIALLTKPYAVFYLLPLLFSYLQKEKKIWPIPLRYLLWIVPVTLPFGLWRVWISKFPEGIPASGWLFNGNNIRFKPAFWRWIILERFGKEILWITGSILFSLGVLLKPQKQRDYLLHFLALSSFLYLIILATGNVQHDYYQTLIVPALVIFTARGFTSLIQGAPGFLPRIITIPLALWMISLALLLSWNDSIKGLYQINNPSIIEAGKEADRILPKEAVVIAPYMGDTAFLYQTNRPGLPIVNGSVGDMKRIYGVTSYVSVNYDNDTNQLMKEYKVLKANPKFVIIDLTEPNSSSEAIAQNK